MALVIVCDSGSKGLGIHVEALGHLEAPFVLDLPAEVQVEFRDQEPIANPGQTLRKRPK